MEASGDVGGAGGPLVGVAGCDDGQCLGQGLGHRQVGQAFVDERVGEGPGLLEVAAQPGGSGSAQDVGGVEAAGQGGVLGVCASGGEDPVVPVCGEVAGDVGVGGHHQLGGMLAGEDVGLRVAQGGPERGDSDMIGAGEADGDGVDRALDQDGGGALGEPVGVRVHAVQLVCFGEQDGLAGVEVLRAGLVVGLVAGLVAGLLVVVGVGVAASDEPDDVLVVLDGQDEPVPEGVDEPAGAGVLGEAGGEELVVGRAVVSQVGGEGGPAGGGVPGPGARVAGEVGAAEAVSEIGLGPGAVVGALIERGGLLVQGGDALGGDGRELGLGGTR